MIEEQLQSKPFTGTCAKSACRVMFLLVKQIVFLQLQLAVDNNYTNSRDSHGIACRREREKCYITLSTI